MPATPWSILAAALATLFAGAAPRAAPVPAGAPRVLEGRVIPAGGGDVRGVRVILQAGGRADSAAVDSAGRFSFALGDADDSLGVWVDAAAAFHPARLRLARKDAAKEQEVVLVPTRWTIRQGRYAGREVRIRLSASFTGACATCTGFFRRYTPRGDPAHLRLRGWPAERFPLRVAFDREWSDVRVTEGDSTAFWSQADELEATFGADVFRPASYLDAAPREEGGPSDVILVWFDPEMHGVGGIGTAVSGDDDDIEYGDVRLNRAALRDPFSNPGLVAHELMHTLGFGHTCAWRSVLADVRRCPGLRAPTATEEDVAYAQLAGEIRALQRLHARRWAVEAALAAMEAPRVPALAAR